MKDLIDFNAIRADRAALVRELESAGAKFKGDSCNCPWHADRNASAGVYQGEDNGWRFKCHAAACATWSGDVLDLRAKLQGIDRGELIRRMRAEIEPPKAGAKKQAKVHATLDALTAAAEFSDPEGGRVAKRYDYANPATRTVEMIVFRIERENGSKTFRQAHPVAGGFVLKGPSGKWPLYNRARVRDAKEIIVCEGEKAVHALHEAGITATTSPGGAGKAALADWSPLVGKSVYLWPDNDPVDPKTEKRTGIVHMQQVAEELAKLDNPPLVYWIDCDTLNLPEKGDAFEFIEAHQDCAGEAVREVMRQAKRLQSGSLAALDVQLAEAVEGKRFCVPLPWPEISANTNALAPSCVCVFAGSPGATKSLCLIQALRTWKREGHKTAVLELEDGTAFHLRRAMAQISGVGDVTDDGWCRANPGKLAQYRKEAAEELELIQNSIEALPDAEPPTSDALLSWVERKAESGCRVIAIDAVTLMRHGQRSWDDDFNFLTGAKRAIEKNGASLFLVTHPRRMAPGQNRNALSMDDMAGGISYSRASQAVLFLAAHKFKTVTIQTAQGRFEESINRTLTVLKSRNRDARDAQFGLVFDSKSLTLREVGRIAEDDA